MTLKELEERIKPEIYKLMDSFLVEGEKMRSVERLNQDRHLFVENLMPLFAEVARETVKAVIDECKVCGGAGSYKIPVSSPSWPVASGETTDVPCECKISGKFAAISAQKSLAETFIGNKENV